MRQQAGGCHQSIPFDWPPLSNQQLTCSTRHLCCEYVRSYHWQSGARGCQKVARLIPRKITRNHPNSMWHSLLSIEYHITGCFGSHLGICLDQKSHQAFNQVASIFRCAELAPAPVAISCYYHQSLWLAASYRSHCTSSDDS